MIEAVITNNVQKFLEQAKGYKQSFINYWVGKYGSVDIVNAMIANGYEILPIIPVFAARYGRLDVFKLTCGMVARESIKHAYKSAMANEKRNADVIQYIQENYPDQVVDVFDIEIESDPQVIAF